MYFSYFEMKKYFPVSPFIRIRNPMIRVRSQSTAVLECEVEAFPEPIVYWEREDGRRLKMSDKYRLEVHDRRDAYKVMDGSIFCVKKTRINVLFIMICN